MSTLIYSDTLCYTLLNRVLRLTQAAGRHWDRHPVYSDDILKCSPTKFKAQLRSANLCHTLRNRALRHPEAAGSHGIDNVFTVTYPCTWYACIKIRGCDSVSSPGKAGTRFFTPFCVEGSFV